MSLFPNVHRVLEKASVDMVLMTAGKYKRTLTPFSPIEAGYLRGPWVMGEQLSVCDYYLFTIARWLEADGVDLAKLPRVVEHRARVTALPLAQRVIAQYESKPRTPL